VEKKKPGQKTFTLYVLQTLKMSTDDMHSTNSDTSSDDTIQSGTLHLQQNDASDVSKDSGYEYDPLDKFGYLLDDVEESKKQNGLFDVFHEQPNKKMKLNSGEAFSTDVPLKEKYIGEDEAVDVSQKVQRMMKKIGYTPDKGLGKDDQGHAEPIKPVTQHDRRGFGHCVPDLKKASLKWNPEEEKIKAIEDIEWLRNVRFDTLLAEELLKWIKLGPKKSSIDDETMFCNPEILKQIINSKTIFDKLDKVEMRKARTRSNPYETIGTVKFLNRAAVKMANINGACDFMFTCRKNLHPNELLYFADVCAGPGGFSEYVLSRKKWHAKGFGFTLQNKNDFTLDEFFAGPCETFHPFYGSKGNGDVFDAQNQEDFRKLVMKHTNGKGVHFMMSDGGFLVEGRENIQEILSKQLYLCQCLVALMIVRPGGDFVTKLFDLFTPFSVGLVYLMYKSFDSISIFKPNSSRPANSERYLICRKKRVDTQTIMDYLSHVNHLLSMNNEHNDVIELVPLDVLEADTEFIRYLRNSNDILGRKQIVNLLKIAAFCEDPTLTEPKQADMRKECLKYWNLPNKTRVRPPVSKPQDKVQEILGDSITLLSCDAKKLKNDNVQSTLLRTGEPYDWYYMLCASGPNIEENKLPTFYLGLGRRRVYRYVRGKWESVTDVKIELPSNTLVYAELVHEFKLMENTLALHILDAYMLGGEDISKLYISYRYDLTKKFCDALWKPAPNDYICIRAKKKFLLTPDICKRWQVSQKLPASVQKLAKSPMEYDNETDAKKSMYAAFNSVMFLRSIAFPWARHISRKTREYYVYNINTKQTKYETRDKINNRPVEADANFVKAFQERMVWDWPYNP
ncbi:Uncharacterized protein DBV15_12748, partial [Temnothorax longispinosus]